MTLSTLRPATSDAGEAVAAILATVSTLDRADLLALTGLRLEADGPLVLPIDASGNVVCFLRPKEVPSFLRREAVRLLRDDWEGANPLPDLDLGGVPEEFDSEPEPEQFAFTFA